MVIELKSQMSFEQYYDKYYSVVLGYITRKINNRYNAEDLTMDVFTSCYQKFDTFDPQKASFQTWLFVIVNNKLKNYYRDKKEPDELDESVEFGEYFEDDIIQAQYIMQMRDYLADAIELLNETQKTIVINKYFCNKNSSEIAEMTGLSPVNVRVQLSRAMTKMKEYFEKKNIVWE